MAGRHPNGFRLSDAFIQRATRLLIWTIVGCAGLLIVLGFATYATGRRAGWARWRSHCSASA